MGRLQRVAVGCETHWPHIGSGVFQLLAGLCGLSLNEWTFSSWWVGGMVIFALAGIGLTTYHAATVSNLDDLGRELAAAKLDVSRHLEAERKVVQAAVQAIHDDYFSAKKRDDHEKFMDRTTLFVCRSCETADEAEKRLEIYARGGRHKSSTTSWGVHDDDETRCAGVAGMAYFHGACFDAASACEWVDGDDDAAHAQQEGYAASIGITVDQARCMRVKSNAVVAMVVIARGEKWGVLVLDSLKRDAFPDRKKMNPTMQRYAAFLSTVMSEMPS